MSTPLVGHAAKLFRRVHHRKFSMSSCGVHGLTMSLQSQVQMLYFQLQANSISRACNSYIFCTVLFVPFMNGG